MNDAKPQSNTFCLLMQAAVRARHEFARVAEEKYQLTWIQLHTLCILDPDEPVPMHHISCQLACDASNVTGLIDRLSAHGLAKRQDDPRDRRLKRIALTKKGEALREAIIDDLAHAVPSGFGRLTDKERQQLQSLLIKALGDAT